MIRRFLRYLRYRLHCRAVWKWVDEVQLSHLAYLFTSYPDMNYHTLRQDVFDTLTKYTTIEESEAILQLANEIIPFIDRGKEERDAIWDAKMKLSETYANLKKKRIEEKTSRVVLLMRQMDTEIVQSEAITLTSDVQVVKDRLIGLGNAHPSYKMRRLRMDTILTAIDNLQGKERTVLLEQAKKKIDAHETELSKFSGHEFQNEISAAVVRDLLKTV